MSKLFRRHFRQCDAVAYRSVKHDSVIVLTMDNVVFLQSLQLNEVVLQVELDGGFVVVDDVEVDGYALLEGLLYQIDCVVKHLCAQT